MERSVIYWRRTDVAAIECLELEITASKITAAGVVIGLELPTYRVEHKWLLDPSWRVQAVTIERRSEQAPQKLHLERAKEGWEVNGTTRRDLDAAQEPDLSITPFCNTIPIRRAIATGAESLQMTTAYIDGTTLGISTSEQRYDRQGPNRFRYVDLGLYRGFEANLVVDELGLVEVYEHLFERLHPTQRGSRRD